MEIENVKPVEVATELVVVGTTESVRSTTTDVAADNTAVDAPAPLDAATETLMCLSMSVSVNSYVRLVAEPIFEYVPPDVVARFHWYVYEVGEPVHDPFEVVNVAPVRVVPVITGIAVFVGAISTTAEVCKDNTALEEPATFVAATAALM